LQRRLGVTTIYVTHDQVEAMVVADRIAVMTNGKVEQIGTPEEVYGRPATLFCARFVGSPKVNEIRGEIKSLVDRTAEILVKAEPGEAASLLIDCEEELEGQRLPSEIILVFRPEDTRVVSAATGAVPAHVTLIENRGAEKYVVAELPPAMRSAQVSADLRFRLDRSDVQAGQALFFVPDRVHVFAEGSQQRITSGSCQYAGHRLAATSSFAAAGR
jgi:ABC-type sugar transport system ATPase subunit